MPSESPQPDKKRDAAVESSSRALRSRSKSATLDDSADAGNAHDADPGRDRSLNADATAHATDSTESAASKPQRFLKKYWWLMAIIAALLLIGGLAVWRLREEVWSEEPVTTTQPNPLSVRTAIAAVEPIRAWISSEGNVRATDYQHLTFETEGDVTYLANRDGRRLREGDRVQAGELLARIDDRSLVADVEQAEAAIAEAQQRRAAATADVAQAQAQVAQAQAQVRQAQAQLETARAAQNLAATNLDRYRYLANQGAVPDLEFDQRQNALQDAESQVQAAIAQVASAREQVSAAQARVTAARQQVDVVSSSIETARARLRQAEVALEGASIYAPFDGIIAYLNVTEGEYFTPQLVTSQLAGDYQGIVERIPMVIIDPSQFEVIVDLAAPSGERVRPGQSAFVASETEVEATAPEATYRERLMEGGRAQGEVFAVNPAISPGGRAIEVRVRLNPDTTQQVQHGEQVTTWIAVEESQDAVTVPLNAVVYREQQPYVFVVNSENQVERRAVELGIEGITRQEILQGVNAGEVVVIAGQNRLVDGAPVQVVNRDGMN